ncbi:MAG: 50S ribosomal protein L9 [Phycisphaerae bacterium]
MKLLLCKTVDKLGIVGDVVEVAPGYGRNYLVPYGLATTPTDANMRALAEARKIAEQERAHQLAQLKALAERLDGAEVTIRARANEQGHLYGSVGAREIAAALVEEEFFVDAQQIVLTDPIRELDNVSVEVKLGDHVVTVKVWVVREKVEGEEDEEREANHDAESIGPTDSGMEAGSDGDGTTGQ